MAIAAPSPALTKIDHCGRRRLRLLLRRGNMNILVRVAIVFAAVAVYWILDLRWRISSRVRAIFLGREPEYHPHHHEDADYHDYYDYEF